MIREKVLVENQESELKAIEKIILPLDCTFSPEQIDVILAPANANIIAGPGSGKTTVLIAKIALVMKQMQTNNKNQGICVITHTNVAVDEIKTKLVKIGIENLEYPNFIGTIHDFFNHFFTYKAYQELYSHKKATLFDDDIYKEKFIEIFEQYKPDSYTYNPPTSRITETYLEFVNKDEVQLIGYCGENYKEALINTFKNLLEIGVFRYNDVLSLSNWYINKYQDPIKKAFSQRFAWAFLDEAQDTNNIQYNLLNKVLNNQSTILQKFGDPYQSLYTMFNNDKDAWVPSQEQEVQSIELSYSTRFGNTIANVLRTTCIEKYQSLKGNPRKKSFKPHLLLYNSKENVIEEYLKLITKLSEDDVDFRINTKKIGVVGLLHEEVRSYHPRYKKNTDVKTKTKTIIKSFFDILVSGFLMYVKNTNDPLQKEKTIYSLNYFNELLNKEEYLNIKSNIALYIREIYLNEGIVKEDTKEKLITTYEKIAKLDGITFNRNSSLLTSCMNYVCDRTIRNYLSYKKSEEKVKDSEDSLENFVDEDIYFGTVHAVKGETHKATLLLESKIIKWDYERCEIFYDCTEIFDFLVGDYRDYTKEGRLRSEVIRNGLKTAYVALSRPTHLAAVAIDKNNFGDSIEEKKQKAIQSGWEIIDID